MRTRGRGAQRPSPRSLGNPTRAACPAYSPRACPTPRPRLARTRRASVGTERQQSAESRWSARGRWSWIEVMPAGAANPIFSWDWRAMHCARSSTLLRGGAACRRSECCCCATRAAWRRQREARGAQVQRGLSGLPRGQGRGPRRGPRRAAQSEAPRWSDGAGKAPGTRAGARPSRSGSPEAEPGAEPEPAVEALRRNAQTDFLIDLPGSLAHSLLHARVGRTERLQTHGRNGRRRKPKGKHERCERKVRESEALPCPVGQ